MPAGPAEGNLRRSPVGARRPAPPLFNLLALATGHIFIAPKLFLRSELSLKRRPSVLKDLAGRAGSLANGVAAVHLERSSALPSLRLLFIPVVSDTPALMKGPAKTTLTLK